nr:hypothetical protein [Rhodococcus sp. JVH1]
MVCLAPSPTFGGIVHEEKPHWNTMKGSNLRRPRGSVQRTARTVDPDNDVTRMMGGVTHSIFRFSGSARGESVVWAV